MRSWSRLLYRMMKPKRLRSTGVPLTYYGIRGRSPNCLYIREMASPDFTVRFWGVRGSIACSGPRTVRYGGNTSSIEVRCDGRMLLFDAGDGIRYLGNLTSNS